MSAVSFGPYEDGKWKVGFQDPIEVTRTLSSREPVGKIKSKAWEFEEFDDHEVERQEYFAQLNRNSNATELGMPTRWPRARPTKSTPRDTAPYEAGRPIRKHRNA